MSRSVSLSASAPPPPPESLALEDPAAWPEHLAEVATRLQRGLKEIPVDGEIGIRAAMLPDFHGDPADRIVVATALNDHRLVTSDGQIPAWNGNLSRVNAWRSRPRVRIRP